MTLGMKLDPSILAQWWWVIIAGGALMMVLKAAKAMDVLGNTEARIWVSAVKALVPERVCKIIDQAIQIHGATGGSQWTPLPGMYISQRTLRLADGPDEVHRAVVARKTLQAYGLGRPGQ